MNVNEETLEILKRVVDRLAPRYRFGIYDVDDIKSEATEFGLDGIRRFNDVARPLENFLYSHIRNRLINLKRNKFKRVETPCSLCNKSFLLSLPSGPHEDLPEKDHGYCKRFKGWVKRNIAKQSLAAPVNQVIENIYECDMDEEIDRQNLFRLIDFNIPLVLRESYLKMRVGDKVSQVQRNLVLTFIRTLKGQ